MNALEALANAIRDKAKLQAQLYEVFNKSNPVTHYSIVINEDGHIKTILHSEEGREVHYSWIKIEF